MFYELRKAVIFFILSAAILPLGCTESTTEKVISFPTRIPTTQWNLLPTFQPDGKRIKYPYLYYTTIIFGGIVLASTFLLVLHACYRNCHHQPVMPARPPGRVVTRFRRSLVPTDAILINSRFRDQPPEYNELQARNESPPPSYGSLV